VSADELESSAPRVAKLLNGLKALETRLPELAAAVWTMEDDEESGAKSGDFTKLHSQIEVSERSSDSLPFCRHYPTERASGVA